MSGDSLDDQGQSKGLQIIGIGSEWERCEALRARLRGEGAVIFEKDKVRECQECLLTLDPWIPSTFAPTDGRNGSEIAASCRPTTR